MTRFQNPRTEEESQMLPGAQLYGTHVLVPTARNSFFSPLARARSNYMTPKQNVFGSFLQIIPPLIIAFSASALAIESSKRYAQTEHEDPLFFQFSSVTAALLINWYGINGLLEEIRNTEQVRLIMMASTLLGILSSLPVFFMLQLINEDKNWLSVAVAAIITISSMPMQVFGFLEFGQHVYPKIKHVVLSRFHSPADSAFSRRQQFLQHLDSGLKNSLARNDIPPDWRVEPDHVLMSTLLSRRDVMATERGIATKWGLLFVGCMGLLLAETVNVSFTKATYDILSMALGKYAAVLLTFCITFPAAILSAEFGYSAACGIYQAGLNFLHQLKTSRTCNDVVGCLTPSVGIHPVAESITLMLVLIIISCSYAASVQFNREVFDESLSSEQLGLVNCLTIFGTWLFNSYALSHIAYQFLAVVLDYFGDSSTKERAQFYRFSLDIISGYQKMPNQFVVDGLDNTLNVEPVEHDTVFSPL